MSPKRKLITTADFSHSKDPVIFLGNWCLNFNNKKIWSKMKFEIFNSKLFDINENLVLNKKTEFLYEKVLEDLKNELNKLHKINWSKRAWRILLGTWLYRYISILNLKVEQIKEVLSKYENIEIENIDDLKNINLACYNQDDFCNKSLVHKYNRYTNFVIFNLITNEKFEESNSLNKIFLKDINKKNKLFFSNIKNFFLKLFERTFCFKNDFVIYKIYFGNIFLSLKLFFLLKQFPFKYSSKEEQFYYKFDDKIRKNLNGIKTSNNQDINEKIVRHLIPEAIPTAYIEGFKKIIEKTNKSYLPKKTKYIYTCNLSADYLFKFWTANQVNSGSRLICGQHGGNYNFTRDQFKLKHELDISEKYLTWGWKKDNQKLVPGYCSSIISKKEYIKSNTGNFLLVLAPNYNYFFYNKASFFNEIKNGEKEFVLSSNKFTYEFLKNNDSIDRIKVRTHPNDFRTETPLKPFLDKNFKNLVYDDNKKKLLDTVNKYDLIIFTYMEATSFLQCMALNKPCIAFTLDKEILDKDNLQYWKKFYDAGIFHSTAESAKTMINKNKSKIDDWWNKNSTQEIVKDYVKKHAFKDGKSISRVVKCLNDFKKDYEAIV